MKILSIDECGRGAAYGPLALGMTLVDYKEPFDSNKRDEVEEEILDWARKVLEYPRLKSLDSKMVKRRTKREELFKNFPLDYVVIFKGANEINTRGKGCLNKIFSEMIQEGIETLDTSVDFLLCDASLIAPTGYNHISIVEGDIKYPSIGASSIVCKVLRDRLIEVMSEDEHVLYDLMNNKGYLTEQHRLALSQLGMTNHHRISFCKKFVRN